MLSCQRYSTGGLRLSQEIFEAFVHLGPLSTWRICSREQAKSECDWLVMSPVFVASQSSCFFLCSREQIRQVELKPALGPFYTFGYHRIQQRTKKTKIMEKTSLKPVFHLANLFARTEKKAT